MVYLMCEEKVVYYSVPQNCVFTPAVSTTGLWAISQPGIKEIRGPLVCA